MRRPALVRMAGVAAVASVAATATACTQVSADPNAVVAVTFDSLPYPAVVAGDTVRDETGTARPLRAAALNSNGDTIPDAAFTFVVVDAGGTVSSEGFVQSTDPAATSLRVLAQAAGLQSRTLTLIVTPSPDSLAREGTTDTLRYVLPDEASNVSGAITLRVLDTDADPPVNARGWIVRYGFAEPADAQRAWFVDESNRRSAEDTASADGRVARRLRVVSDQISAPGPDSVVVLATATAKGSPLAGAPVRVVIHLKPR